MNSNNTIKELVYSADERFGEEVFAREIVRKNFQDHSFHQFRLDCDSTCCLDSAEDSLTSVFMRQLSARQVMHI